MKDLYTFNDYCLDVAALVRIAFNVQLNLRLYNEMLSEIKSRYVIACNNNGKFADQDLMAQAHMIERRKLFGPF